MNDLDWISNCGYIIGVDESRRYANLQVVTNMSRCRKIFIAVAICLTLGCKGVPSNYFSATPSFLRGTPTEVRSHLLTLMPIGTPREDVNQLVKSLGLELTPQSELASVTADAIECRHTVQNGPFGQTTWVIRIDCPDEKVSDILCEPIGVSFW